MTRRVGGCPHAIGVQTTWYEVPCGVPIHDPTDRVDCTIRLATCAADGLMMLRAWCDTCHGWQEPLLSRDGLSYMEETADG